MGCGDWLGNSHAQINSTIKKHDLRSCFLIVDNLYYPSGIWWYIIVSKWDKVGNLIH